MTELSQIPNTPHWAILETVNVHIPGDERSRTNPGHGYPEHTETYLAYRVFTDESAWRLAVERLSLNGQIFRAIKVEPATISIKVDVK